MRDVKKKNLRHAATEKFPDKKFATMKNTLFHGMNWNFYANQR